MSRLTTMRKETRKNARRANKKVNKKMAPVASDARETAMRYAETTRDWAAPRVEAARDWAAPHMEPVAARVKDDVLPKVAGAVTAALAASEPAREEAKTRGTAAIAALRGEIEAPKPKKHRLRKLFLLAGVVGAAVAGWKAWMGQQNRQPDPWATPISSAPTASTGGSMGASSGGSTLGGVAPVTDDTGGASPDEALADAAEEDLVSKERTNPGSPAGDTSAASGATTTEKVPPKAAKKAKAAGEAGRSTARKST